jgi:hypothetical protein
MTFDHDVICQRGSIGNNLMLYYSVQLLAARVGKVIHLSCSQSDNSLQYNLPSHHEPDIFLKSNELLLKKALLNQSWFSFCSHCGHFSSPHLCPYGMQDIVPLVRLDLYRLAKYWMDANPRQAETLDDVAIHIRCGDVMSLGLGHNEHGHKRRQSDTEKKKKIINKSISRDGSVLPFTAYKQIFDRAGYKSYDIFKIGIITLSFDKHRCRAVDCPYISRCKHFINGVKQYLEVNFRNASVIIRNGNDENFLSAYSRIIMARTSICSPSTFCVLPAIASQGMSYIVKSEKYYPWLSSKYINFANRANISLVNTHLLNWSPDVVSLLDKAKSIASMIYLDD